MVGLYYRADKTKGGMDKYKFPLIIKQLRWLKKLLNFFKQCLYELSRSDDSYFTSPLLFYDIFINYEL